MITKYKTFNGKNYYIAKILVYGYYVYDIWVKPETEPKAKTSEDFTFNQKSNVNFENIETVKKIIDGWEAIYKNINK